MDFLKLMPLDAALEDFFGRWKPGLRVETLPWEAATGRVLAEAVRAASDIPGFARSTVDGFAVMAEDTFGASESLPGLLQVTGEVPMGSAPTVRLEPGTAIKVATGAMLPAGADAAVMIEHTEALDEGAREVGVTRPVAPGENIIRRGEDLAAGGELLAPGRRLTPYDIGALSGVGFTEVKVFVAPRVAVISTGDEVVPASAEPGPGQVRDINGPALAAAVVAEGGTPMFMGIYPDEFAAQEGALRTALENGADMVLVSGGSSVGARDLTASAINSLGQPGVFLHGLAVRPGKPTIAALVGGVPVIGLPGHPASALVVFEVFVRPILQAMQGLTSWERPWVWARLTRNLASGPGREDFVRVRLRPAVAGGVAGHAEPAFEAEPVLGKSGLISTLVRADGLLRIPLEKEGLRAGETVKVVLL